MGSVHSFRRSRAWLVCGIVGSVAGSATGAVDDRPFFITPGRNLSDSGSTALNNSVHNQGGNVGDIRNSTLSGNDAWDVFQSGGGVNDDVDEQIVNNPNAVKSGNQALHVSNYFNSFFVNHITTPWLDQPAGESGSKDDGGTGITATSNTFHMSFWFKSAATTDPSPGVNGTGVFGPNFSYISISPDDGIGSRWGGRLDISDKVTTNGLAPDNGGVSGAGVQVAWESIHDRPGEAGGGDAFSPVLAYDTWYRIELNITFNEGNLLDGGAVRAPNDLVVLQVFDEFNVLQWQADQTTVYTQFDGTGTSTGITTWENSGFTATERAVNSVSMRMRVDPDTGLSNGDDLHQTSRPAGFFFDDFLMETGAGRSYFTSFEIPEPASAVMLALGGLMLAARRRV